MIDHIGISVSDYEKSKEFYQKALSSLWMESIMEMQGWCGMGKSGNPEFWFGKGETTNNPMHIAFSADNRTQVDEFYTAAIDAGAKDNGKPGIRSEYHANYYAAYIYDPDGHNIEAVCHKPE